MAGRQDIEAGKAYVLLQLRQDVQKGLLAAKQRLQDFGSSMAATGAKIALVGASITAPLSAAVKMYRDIGERLLDTTGTATQIAENNKLRASYARLGVTFTREGIRSLGQAMDAAATATKAISLALGQALAPVMAESLRTTAKLVAGVVSWIRQNGELFRLIYRVGGAVTLAGLAIIKLGGAVIFAGAVLGGLSTILGLVLTPVGLIVTTLAAAVAGFVAFSNMGRQAFQIVTAVATRYGIHVLGWFGRIAAVGRETWGGIVDAMGSGDLQLAAQIGLTGVYLAFLTAAQEIHKLWVAVKYQFLSVWTAARFAAESILLKLWSGIQTGWAFAVGAMELIWDKFLSHVADSWNKLQKGIGNLIISAAEKSGIVSKDFADKWRQSLEAPIDEKIGGRERDRNKSEEERQARHAERIAKIAQDGAQAQADLAREKAAAEEANARGPAKDIAAWEQSRLDAQKKLKELRDKARGKAPGAELPAGEELAAAGGPKSVGSFSAAALVALGTGQGPAAEAEKTRKDIRKNVILMNQEIKRMREEQAQRRMVFA